MIFCYPDQADQNQTDPDPQHWLKGSNTKRKTFCVQCMRTGASSTPHISDTNYRTVEEPDDVDDVVVGHGVD